LKHLLGLFISLLSLNVFAHGGDSGPSTLEQEFSKLSHVHVPVNYSTHEGYYLGYEIGAMEEGLVFENHPVAFGGMDKIVRATCLDQSLTEVIELCPENSPYVLLENKKWDLGLGFESHMHLPIPGVGLGAGISYLKGKNYYSFRYLTHKNEKRTALNFPVNPEEFKNWRSGDQLSYMSKGTIVFSVYVGFEPFVHLGPQIFRTGVYRISMKKIDDKTLIAEIANLKSKDLSLEGSAIFAGGELSGGKGKSNSVTYEFDMEAESTYPVLAHFIAGRLDLVNQAALVKSDSINRGRSALGSFGFPMLFNRGGYRGTYASQGSVEELEEGHLHKHDVYSLSKVKDRSTRGVLSEHMWENKTLVTTIIKEKDEPTHSLLSVVLNWTFSRDHVKLSQFEKKIRKVARITGLSKLREIKLPDGTRGYVKIDLSINLSAEHVLKVLTPDQKAELEDHQNKNEYQALNKKLMKFMNAFFKEKDEQWFLENNPQIQVGIEGENLKKSVIHL